MMMVKNNNSDINTKLFINRKSGSLEFKAWQ